VGDLQSVGYGGQPVREVFRVVRPPAPVLVDLASLFPREPHARGRYHPFGLQMNHVVDGQLTCWALCGQDQCWGLVTYPIRYGGLLFAVATLPFPPEVVAVQPIPCNELRSAAGGFAVLYPERETSTFRSRRSSATATLPPPCDSIPDPRRTARLTCRHARKR
jgi:hypothetical protein